MYGLALSSVVLALLLVLQTIGLPKPITGLFVNASIIVVTRRCGPAYGMLLGLTTPCVALLTGILPPPLLALLFPIALGNVTFVALYHLSSTETPFQQKSSPAPVTCEAEKSSTSTSWLRTLLRLTLAPLGKALVITLGAHMLSKLFSLPETILPVLQFIVLLQFATALGGILLGEYLDKRLPLPQRTARTQQADTAQKTK